MAKYAPPRSITEYLEFVGRHQLTWAAKRLSGNDTGLTGGHQAGVYLPRTFFQCAFPEICRVDEYNPSLRISRCTVLDGGFETQRLRATYYNSKFHPDRGTTKKYDEFRLTGWGGRASPVQDPESTGSIAVFAIARTADGIEAWVWVASGIDDESAIEDWLGEPVEPGRCITAMSGPARGSDLLVTAIPPSWFEHFPSGRDLFKFVTQQIPRSTWRGASGDLLLARRAREFEVFRVIEERVLQAKLQSGFESVAEFVTCANSVTNRRKSRAGTSLELNLEATFQDENIAFESQAITEERKRPDFLFPGARAYHSENFPDDALHMLAVKTCCRDRWRQVLSEADRIKTKHLFTLQEGVSSNQLNQMQQRHVVLVVPESHLSSFPRERRSEIVTLGRFLETVKRQQAGIDLARWTT